MRPLRCRLSGGFAGIRAENKNLRILTHFNTAHRRHHERETRIMKLLLKIVITIAAVTGLAVAEEPVSDSEMGLSQFSRHLLRGHAENDLGMG